MHVTGCTMHSSTSITGKCPNLWGISLRFVRSEQKYDLQVLRFFMLSAHYRSPLNFSADIMEASKNAYERIVTAADRLKELSSAAKTETLTEEESGRLEEMKQFRAKYEEAMDDDLNTADALAAIFELVKFANTEVTETSSKAFADRVLQEICELCEISGTDRGPEEGVSGR